MDMQHVFAKEWANAWVMFATKHTNIEDENDKMKYIRRVFIRNADELSFTTNKQIFIDKQPFVDQQFAKIILLQIHEHYTNNVVDVVDLLEHILFDEYLLKHIGQF